MKNLYVSLVILMLPLFWGCKKNADPTWSATVQSATGTSNVSGNSVTAAFHLQSGTLTVGLTRPGAYPSITLTMCCNVVTTGVYNTTSGFSATLTADANAAFPTSSGALYLSFDAGAKNVSGNFAFSAGSGSGAGVTVTEGIFSTVPVMVSTY